MVFIYMIRLALTMIIYSLGFYLKLYRVYHFDNDKENYTTSFFCNKKNEKKNI